ncbi:hypothetical protein MYIN104542_00250 [Mycobacterium intermedium]
MNAATNSGNDAPKLACKAALMAATSVGALRAAARLATKFSPASMNPLRPPLRLAARLAPTC